MEACWEGKDAEGSGWGGDGEEVLGEVRKEGRGSEPREDYRELLELAIRSLNGALPNFRIRRPGALHQARWMAKLLQDLAEYHNDKISAICLSVFGHHLLYLSESLVGLTLFDPQVNTLIKKNIARAILVKEAPEDTPKRDQR
ncbi:hypothetical protein Pcinc_039838 [Petrolisthes cinctipes]|uniref:Uncharacterized protein n=1 Tax=Petrolisthes cinctipes TaxID=88211 RepID=A0AAE1BNZ0_PETCI|nr:hypothetical protein Pcinc_039838 [Petrolisthes cinctipes]